MIPALLMPSVAALLAGAALGAWAGHAQGYKQGRAPLQTELAQLREAHSETARLAALAGTARLVKAQARSDALAGILHAQIAQNDSLTLEKTRALQTATAGRACLSDRALGLLNGAPGITLASPGTLPAPERGLAAPSAQVATDSDLAGWIVSAGNLYEQCRNRHNALIAFHTPASSATAPAETP